LQAGLSVSLSVPPFVRAALFQRDVDSADLLRSLDVPVLLVHGADDAVVDPRATEYAAALIPDATTRIYPGVGHLPFVERAEQFRADLAAFVASTKAGSLT
jgi:pimeloyl-ACP methyl ester carboxylesterase